MSNQILAAAISKNIKKGEMKILFPHG